MDAADLGMTLLQERTFIALGTVLRVNCGITCQMFILLYIHFLTLALVAAGKSISESNFTQSARKLLGELKNVFDQFNELFSIPLLMDHLRDFATLMTLIAYFLRKHLEQQRGNRRGSTRGNWHRIRLCGSTRIRKPESLSQA